MQGPTNSMDSYVPYDTSRIETGLPKARPMAEVSLPKARPMAEVSLPRAKPMAEVSLPRAKPMAELVPDKIIYPNYGSLEASISHTPTSGIVPEIILNDTNVKIPGTDKYFYGYPTYPSKNDRDYQIQLISVMQRQLQNGTSMVSSNLSMAIKALRAKSAIDGESFATKYKRLVDYIDPENKYSDYFDSFPSMGGKKTKKKRSRKSKKK